MIERALAALAAVLLFAGGYLLFKRLQLRAVRNSGTAAAAAAGTPGILYFWSPGCGVCRSTQKPVLDRLAATLGEERLKVTAVNVAEQPELARKYRVLTVPTTVVLDGRGGEVRCINNGVAEYARLAAQVEEVRTQCENQNYQRG